jgi:branched-chain amino acid transport system substrate-binding protein
MTTMINRRDFLKLSALAAPGLAGFSDVFAQSDAIRFASANPMSGPFAANGKFADLGMKLAIETYGKVLGKGLHYTALDTEAKPATALRKVQEEIQKGTRFFAGGMLTPETLAMGKEASKSDSILFTLAGSDEITGSECNRGTFRWPMPSYGAIAQTVRPLLEKVPNAKRWYTITPQYIFGEGMLAAAKAIFQEKGVEHVGNSFHALAEKEFSGHLTNAMAAKPDVLLLLSFGAPSSDVLRQAASFGIKNKTTILLAWASGLEQFESLGADICDGVYFGAQYWHGIDTPFNKKFVQLVNAKLKMDPNYSLAGSYMGTKIMLDAIVKANSLDAKAVIATLEGMKYEGLTGAEEIRKGDHQIIKNYYLLKGKSKAKMQNKNDYAEIVSFGKAYLPVEKTMCKMA